MQDSSDAVHLARPNPPMCKLVVSKRKTLTSKVAAASSAFRRMRFDNLVYASRSSTQGLQMSSSVCAQTPLRSTAVLPWAPTSSMGCSVMMVLSQQHIFVVCLSIRCKTLALKGTLRTSGIIRGDQIVIRMTGTTSRSAASARRGPACAESREEPLTPFGVVRRRCNVGRYHLWKSIGYDFFTVCHLMCCSQGLV